MDHFIFFLNRQWILGFKLIELVVLLEHILYKSTSAVCHFTETIVQSSLHWTDTITQLVLLQVRQMPDIMSYKFFHPIDLNMLHQILL